MTETRLGLAFRARVALLAVAAGALLLAFAVVPPFAQPEAYHQFADTRPWLGIPNFGDVASNLAIALAGLAGLWILFIGRGRQALAGQWIKAPLLVHFAAVVWIAYGSAYYHWAPDTMRLYWDRLPMAVAFMALVATFVTDRIDAKRGALYALPALVILGAACTTWWQLSERAGQGDLRAYFLVQAVLFVSLPLITALFPGKHTTGRALIWVGVCYAAAIACEQLDAQVLAATGGAVSGHTLKHLFAACAVGAVVVMVRRVVRVG
jgi:hypothetical protein